MKSLYIVAIPRKKAIAVMILIHILAFILLALIRYYPSSSTFSENISTLSKHLHNSVSQRPSTYSKLAIIIDDFGSDRAGVKELMSINRHITFAVMPFVEHSQADAKAAFEKGYEVIVHLPMEPYKGKKSWLGPNPILSGMDSPTVERIVREALESVPHAIGANIHMGSKASGEEPIITGIMKVMTENSYYFVDSMTASHRLAKKIAEEKGVLCYERDVFLDGQQSKDFVKNRLIEACKIAQKKGHAIAIGHVGIEGGKVTAEAITEMLPYFDENNVRLVFVSELNK